MIYRMMSIDLTRMECKVMHPPFLLTILLRIDLTRMECKDSCY